MKTALIGLALALGLSPAVAGDRPATSGRAAELTPAAVDAYLTRALDETGLPGLSAVVTRGDRVVHAAGYGHDSDGRPVTADTPMRIASVSKSFTAMAVMTLVDKGTVALDDPVAEHLPEVRLADPRAGRITVRHLLNQTSGLSDTTTDIGALEDATSLRDYVGRLGATTLRADPGTRWEYCNVNYNLAARLVEVVSGRSFGDYLRERVFGPLGMRSSAVSDREVRPADGYNSVFGLWRPRPELPAFRDGGGSGGVVTTAADMGRWLITQTGNGRRLVRPESLAVMHAPSEVHAYGMGWGIDDETKRLTHSGNLFTYTAVQVIVPETGYGFAVMTNSAALHDDTFDIATGLAELSEGRTPEAPGGGRQLFELALGAVTLGAAGLGILGVLRSRRWAARRAGRPRWRAGARLVPVLLPVGVLAAYPDLLSFLMNGRTVTWEQLTYFPAPMTITVAVAAAAGALTTGFRVAGLLRGRGTREAGARR
ncbi:CubicO group peptidase (beta-lactamase class C family) [Nonomuraea muscovyensis]|uniref:CubicO group peptidase (Beta-lactamase class C family) n=1 Tax=Nonomuraea muscovyensis TaxID=1124761 RepID=A0A7X0CAQ2_9ACTN|nr:serine hydrolase domain-containing protein [Nonomuraea muscovyensis]MBB6351702.1 CubicO group peptidase (beta-lactamase class C family) [Nonomuraea muscovyensis]